MLLFGFLLLISISEGIPGFSRQQKPLNITADPNFPGIIYNIISKPQNANTPFVISPLGISRVLGLLLFAMKFASSEEIIRILYPKIRGNSSDLPPRPQILPVQQTAIKELTAVLVHPSIPINVFFELEADDVSALLLKTTFEKENLEKLDKIAEKSLDMPRVFSKFFPFGPSNRIIFFNYLQFEGQFENRLKFDPFHKCERVNRLLTLFEYNEELATAIVGLRFRKSNAILLLMQPMNTRGDQGSLPDLEKALKTVDLRKIRRRLRIRMLHLCLPKITMFSSFNLKESLIQAGVKRVFDSSIVDAPRYAERVDQKQERLPLDNIRVSTHFLMEEDGITFAHYPAKNVTYEYVPGDIKEIDLEGVVNISMKRFIYAVVDPQQVYLMGRYVKD